MPGCETPAAAKGGAEKTGAGKTGRISQTPNVVHIASGGLIYSGILRQADFTGGFRADTSDATIQANQGIVYLQQAASTDSATGKSAAPPSLAGGLERVVATGHVGIEQPGLRATGERLLYTASDQVYLLMGDSNDPPKAVDAQGTTTGAALRFHHSCDGSGSDSVEALGAIPGVPARRVHTEFQVSNDGKKEKGK
jgi:lipopolysaccharide export system protein LptA